jgi:hypothetical protein
MATQKIKGKIIRIIDKRTVVINLGGENGINNNSVFYILGEPEEIQDPFTNEILGTVNVTKTRVKASQVFEKFTIATTTWTVTSYRSSVLSLLSAGVAGSGYETKEVDEGELNVNSKELQPWKARSETPVKIGDEVEVTVEVQEQQEMQANSTEEIEQN